MSLPLDKLRSFSDLCAVASLPQVQEAAIASDALSSECIHTPLFSYAYTAARLNKKQLSLLQTLTEEQAAIPAYQQLLAGDFRNKTETRNVRHTDCRASQKETFYQSELERLYTFSDTIREKNKIDTIVQIGIGGSYLGPQTCYEALYPWVRYHEKKTPLTVRFLANVDPIESRHLLESINFDSTLFLAVSKSGSTQETSANLALLNELAAQKGLSAHQLKKQLISVTCRNSALDDASKFSTTFYMDEAIGGRFSVTSAVGALVLSLAFGTDIVKALLSGAHQTDLSFLSPDIKNNAALLDAAISVWHRTFLGYHTKAIIPYASPLRSLPSYLQQLICESLGKRVDVDNHPVSYHTSPIVFGELGCNAQHSFFQQLHQGTMITPVQFIGFDTPIQADPSPSELHNQAILNSHLHAQILALANGNNTNCPAKLCPGDRPSTLIRATILSPSVMGALLSFYEASVFFQGVLYHINAFDQEGVQLGKTIANSLLNSKKES